MYPDTARPDPEYPSCTDDEATDQSNGDRRNIHHDSQEDGYTNQDTSSDFFIPVLYQLRLEKLTRNYRSLEAKVTEMGEYTRDCINPIAHQ